MHKINGGKGKRKGEEVELRKEAVIEEKDIEEDLVIKRVLKAVRSGKEDKEAFEELRRINKEKREEIGEERSNMIGKELIEEFGKKEVVSVEEVLKLVLEGANLDLQDNDGRTALIWATMNNNKGVVELLVKLGANLDLQNKYGRTALMVAALIHDEGIVEVLLKAGLILLL
ncbi:MAG: ankyrin repeat domain-containing protein [Candidatus Anstonellales archaeon]